MSTLEDEKNIAACIEKMLRKQGKLQKNIFALVYRERARLPVKKGQYACPQIVIPHRLSAIIFGATNAVILVMIPVHFHEPAGNGYSMFLRKHVLNQIALRFLSGLYQHLKEPVPHQPKYCYGFVNAMYRNLVF